MKKILTHLTGTVTLIDLPQEYNRGSKAHVRQTIGLLTSDKQLLFLELRDTVYKRFVALTIEVGDLIDVGFFFDGSQKGERRFNNNIVQEVNFIM